VFCLLVVLVKLSLLAKWLARKTPLRKPNHCEGIVSRKPRPKIAHDFLGLLYCFIVLLCICVVSCPYVIYYHTVMVRCSLFVLKVPINPKQTNILVCLVQQLPADTSSLVWRFLISVREAWSWTNLRVIERWCCVRLLGGGTCSFPHVSKDELPTFVCYQRNWLEKFATETWCFCSWPGELTTVVFALQLLFNSKFEVIS